MVYEEFTRLKEAESGIFIEDYRLRANFIIRELLNMVYKYVKIDKTLTMKQANYKATHPRQKQIFRTYNKGIIRGDRLGFAIASTEKKGSLTLQLIRKKENPWFNLNL